MARAAPLAAAAAAAGASLGTLLRVLWQRQRQERSSRWSRERLERHQAQALARLRRRVAERSPFYRRFHRGLEGRGLEALPILDKATLMENFDDLVTDRAIRLADVERHLACDAERLYLDRYVALATSGSTGRRGVFLFDRTEWLAALAAIARPLAWSATPPPWQRPRGALIASAAPWHYSARIARSLASRLLPTLHLDAELPLAAIVQRLNDWQPQLLAVYPSVLLPLADAQLAGQLHIAPLHIGTSAERLPAETRRRVALAFPAAQLRDTYGATEYAPIATECSEGRLHLLEDRAIIEVVDGRGRAVPPGEAGERVLLTVLDRHTQPLIRYELSDGVRERPGRCACGRPFRMLEGIEGRVEETLSFAAASGGGAAVAIHPNAIHALLERVPASGWQVVQGAAGELTVYLSGTPRVGIAEALRGGLLEMLRLRGAVPPPVEVRWSEALQRGASGKAPLIAAHRAARR